MQAFVYFRKFRKLDIREECVTDYIKDIIDNFPYDKQWKNIAYKPIAPERILNLNNIWIKISYKTNTKNYSKEDIVGLSFDFDGNMIDSNIYEKYQKLNAGIQYRYRKEQASNEYFDNVMLFIKEYFESLFLLEPYKYFNNKKKLDYFLGKDFIEKIENYKDLL